MIFLVHYGELALKGDNKRTLVIHVVPGVPILIVNGVPHRDPDLDETFYLETALSISDSKMDGARGVRITPNSVVSIHADQLTSQESFLDYRLVILANVSSIPEAAVGKLEEFVKAGYGLVIFDGDQLDHQRYNQDLYRNGKGLLPVRLGALAKGSTDEDHAQMYVLVPSLRDHPILELFSDIAVVTDPKVIRNWRTVTLPEGKEADPMRPSRTILSVNEGSEAQPYMIERRFGRGRVIYFAGTVSGRWNDLWRSSDGLPLFLYLEVVSYLTGNEARYSNLAVGERYRRILRTRDIAPIYEVRDPNGTTQEIPPSAEDGMKMLEFAGTARPGIYTVTASDRVDGERKKRKWQERFAVNTEARESNVVKLGAEGRDARAEVVQALGEGIEIEFESADAVGDDETLLSGDDGGGLWMWFAIFAASFLVMETLWSARITKAED